MKNVIKFSLISLILVLSSCAASLSPAERTRREQAPLEFSTKYPNGWSDLSKEEKKFEKKKVKGPIKNKF